MMLLLSVSLILNDNPNDLTCSTCLMAARAFNAILCGFFVFGLLCLFQFAEKYGQIFSIRFFGPRIVVLNGLKLVREAYVHQGENFADRPSLPIFADIVGDKGDFPPHKRGDRSRSLF